MRRPIQSSRLSIFRASPRRVLTTTTLEVAKDFGAGIRQAPANMGTTHMIRSTATATLAICSLLASFTPLLAASPAAAPAVPGPSPAVGTSAASSHPAEKCLGDVKAFSEAMSKNGYWLGGSGYGYGYPMGGYGLRIRNVSRQHAGG